MIPPYQCMTPEKGALEVSAKYNGVASFRPLFPLIEGLFRPLMSGNNGRNVYEKLLVPFCPLRLFENK